MRSADLDATSVVPRMRDVAVATLGGRAVLHLSALQGALGGHRRARGLLEGRARVPELTGFGEPDLIGRDVVDALQFSDPKPVELAREWGVRRLGEQLSIKTRSGSEKRVVADVFPAYDDDGGLLVALTPKRG